MHLIVVVDQCISTDVLGILCGICKVKEKSCNLRARGEETL